MTEDLRIKTECAVCPTKIWLTNRGRLKKSDEYREVTVRLNDETNMKVGVCSEHTKPTEDDLARMTEKVHQGWLEELALGVGSETWVRDKGLKLVVRAVA